MHIYNIPILYSGVRALNIKQLVKALNTYFSLTGSAQHFVAGGAFADISLDQRLKAFADRYESDKNFRTTIQNILEWDGEFASLKQHQVALQSLTDLTLYDIDLSQQTLVKHWQRYCQLSGRAAPEIRHGICYGLAMASTLSSFVSNKDYVAFGVNRLLSYEKVIREICAWNGEELNYEVKDHFHALHDIVLPLQRNQEESYQPIANQCVLDKIPERVLGLGLVHNESTLAELFKTILSPGNIVILAAEDHIVRATVTETGGIVYYDPNHKLGFQEFDANDLSHFLHALKRSFQYQHAARFSLVVKVYAQRNYYNIQSIVERLTAVADGHNVLTAIGTDGQDALSLSARANLPECINYLVQQGCQPGLRGVRHLNNAFHSAASIADATSMLALLKSNRAGINAYNRSGLTPLQVAVYDNCPQTVAALLESREVNIDKRTGAKSGVPGKTAIQMAALFGYNDILNLLAEQYAKLFVTQAAIVH